MKLCNVPGCYSFGKYCQLHGTIPHSTKKERKKLYPKLKKKYMEEHQVCEFEDCYEAATDLHHMGGRVGENLVNVNKFMAVCRKHHIEINDNPLWALVEGYTVSRLKK